VMMFRICAWCAAAAEGFEKEQDMTMGNNSNAARNRQVTLVANNFPYAQMKLALGKRDGRSQRAAFFLDWAARTMPHVFIPYNEIVRCIYDTKSLPRMESEEVVALRITISTVRHVLFVKYSRWTTNAVNGVRATTGDDDVTAACPRITSRMDSVSRTLANAVSLIDTKKMKDKQLREYAERVLYPLVKQLGAPAFQRNLLPPVSDETDKKPDPKKK